MTLLLEENTNKYVLKKKIGSGATCECYLGQNINIQQSEIYAIKIFNEKYYEYYLNEIALLLKLTENNNIIKLYGYGKGFLSSFLNNTDYADNNRQIVYYQVMEYAHNGELKDYLNEENSRIPEKISAKLFIQIINAVKYLHENNIAHCDLKPENILLDKNFNIKLNDFGFSQEFNGENGDFLLHKFSGTIIYCSPETKFAFTKGFDGIKNDIYSLGVLLFVITIGDFPYQRTSYSDEKYKYIIKKKYDKFWEYFNNVEISDEFKDLINNLLSVTPSQRLSIEQILTHPWLVKNLGEKYIMEYNNLSKRDNYNNEIFDQEIFDEFNSRKK